MGHGVPELVLELNGRTWTLDPSRSYTAGTRSAGRHGARRRQGLLAARHHPLGRPRLGHRGPRQHQRHLRAGPADPPDGDRPRLGRAPGQRHRRPAAEPSAAAAAGAYSAQPAHAPQQQAAQRWPAPPAQQPPRTSRRPAAASSSRRPAAAGPAAGSSRRSSRPAGPQPSRRRQAAPQRPAQRAAPPVYGDRSPTTFHQLALGRVMRIGRALENELVVSDLQVSRHHAEFHATPDGRFEIRDLGSHNGTYVNGQPIAKSGTALIGPNDIVGVGHSTFRLVGDRLEEFVDTGEVSFSARHLTVTVDGGKQILKDVSFGVPEKSLIARHRPVRLRQVDAAEGADRLPPRQPGRCPLRQPEPLQAVRRAAPAHRSGPAGRHPAQGADRREGPQVRGQAPLPRRHRGVRARGRASTRCCASSSSTSTRTRRSPRSPVASASASRWPWSC